MFNKSQTGAGNTIENALEKRITAIYKNEDEDNKTKISKLVELFNNEVVVQYKKVFENVVKGHSESTKNEYVKDFKYEK